MWKFICVFIHCFVLVLSQLNAQGDGVWSVIDIDKCDTDIENEIMTFDVEKRKINHTHEEFHAKIGAKMIIDDAFKLHAIICKHVDGGCKHYANVYDGMAKLLNKHAKNNLDNAFVLAGIEPPEFPIPEGIHVIDNFILDYCELSSNCPYGRFEAQVFVIKDEERVGCLKAVVEFAEDDSCL